MSPLRYWPPLIHLTVILACAVVAWWRIDAAPGVPATLRGPEGADVEPAAIAAVATDASARDARADVDAVAARALLRPPEPARDVEPAEVAARTEPVPAEPEPAASRPFPEFRMVGYVEHDRRGSAILQSIEDGRSQVVHEGDDIGGARVVRITPDAVVVESDGGQRTLQLYPD